MIQGESQSRDGSKIVDIVGIFGLLGIESRLTVSMLILSARPNAFVILENEKRRR